MAADYSQIELRILAHFSEEPALVDAFQRGEETEHPIEMYLPDVSTIPVNLAGLPGSAVRCGLSPDGLPVGAQLIGRAFDEETLLRAAAGVERLAGFKGLV